MIKKFEQFVIALNEELNAKYVVTNKDLLRGSDDMKLARAFIKEMTRKEAPSGMYNIGKLIDFCVDNYYGFNDSEAKELSSSIDEIKNMIKNFFSSTEIEMDTYRELGYEDDEKGTMEVDAVFRNVRRTSDSSNARGMLQKFFETFWYIKTHTTKDSTGLDKKANDLISSIIQEIKTVWDPEGIDGWWIIGGDSDAIENTKKYFKDVYGGYAEAKTLYLNGQKPADNAAQGKTPAATSTSTTQQNSTSAQQTTATTAKKTSTPTQKAKPAGTSGKQLSFR
jgi:hypothetical protein